MDYGRAVYVHFHRSTTIGIASEILRLSLAKASLMSCLIIPVYNKWPRLIRSNKYPIKIYTAIEAPQLKEGNDCTCQIIGITNLLSQFGDFILSLLVNRNEIRRTIHKGHDGLYVNSPQLFSAIMGQGSRIAALRKVAIAIRGYGPVTLRKEFDRACKKELGTLGITQEDWFVCLHVRTSVFHNDSAGYRNAKLERYYKAIDYICNLGGKVILMGDPRPELNQNPKAGLIDYVNMPIKSESMDLYLIKNCRFFIGTLSGILDTAYLFQTPTLCVNSLHFDFRSSNPCDRVLYKKILHRDTGKILTFSDSLTQLHSIIDPDWELHYEFIENSEGEILSATQEIIQVLECKTRPTLRQLRARRKLIRKRLEYAYSYKGELTMLSASIAFSRCQIVDSSLDERILE